MHSFSTGMSFTLTDSETEFKRLAMVICHVLQLHHLDTTELLNPTNHDLQKKQLQRQDVFCDEG